MGQMGTSRRKQANISHLMPNIEQADVKAMQWKQLQEICFQGNGVIAGDHHTVCSIDLNNILLNKRAFLLMSESRCPNLAELSISDNDIGRWGCKMLSLASWQQLRVVHLQRNKIDNKGCSYLRRANWPQIRVIDLVDNILTNQGCKSLTEANWAHLQELYLSNYLSQFFRNKICDQGLRYLLKSNWELLILSYCTQAI